MRRGRQPKRRHIFIGLGLVLGCVWYRHSISFQFHKTNLICRNISCSWRFRRCWSCNYRISRDGAIHATRTAAEEKAYIYWAMRSPCWKNERSCLISYNWYQNYWKGMIIDQTRWFWVGEIIIHSSVIFVDVAVLALAPSQRPVRSDDTMRSPCWENERPSRQLHTGTKIIERGWLLTKLGDFDDDHRRRDN